MALRHLGLINHGQYISCKHPLPLPLQGSGIRAEFTQLKIAEIPGPKSVQSVIGSGTVLVMQPAGLCMFGLFVFFMGGVWAQATWNYTFSGAKI